MPPVFLAVVVDRVVAVVRRHVLGDSERSAWTGFGRVVLYVLRFVLAMPSTAKGLRRQVLILAPLPGTSTPALSSAVTDVAALPAAETPGSAVITMAPAPARARGTSKSSLLIEAYEALAGVDARYGDRTKASQVAKELAAKVGMQWGSARSVLYRHLDARAEASS